jgi:hypothetical protein
MGWLFSICMLLIGCFSGNNILVVTSGLFAIAGAIGVAGSNISEAIKKINKRDTNNLDAKNT